MLEILSSAATRIHSGSPRGRGLWSGDSTDPYAAAARDEGVPSDVVDLLVYLFGEVLDGRNVAVADGVQRALGRPPRDFADFAREAAATGIWNGAR